MGASSISKQQDSVTAVPLAALLRPLYQKGQVVHWPKLSSLLSFDRQEFTQPIVLRWMPNNSMYISLFTVVVHTLSLNFFCF